MRKIIGGLIIILTGVYLGFSKSLKYKKHEANLNFMIESLTIMQTRISFCADRLGEIFKSLSTTIHGEIGTLFQIVSKKIDQGYAPVTSLWDTLKENQKQICFSERDMGIMEELCKQLGKNDCAHEICQIKKAIEELSQNRKEAQTEIAKEGKLMRSFYLMGSILLVILLI